MNEARERFIQALWEAIDGIPGLAERARVSREDLFEEDPCAVGVGADDYWFLISVDASGVYSFSYTTRGNDRLEFLSNHPRSLAVYVAYAMIGRSNYPDLGHSPYLDAPFMLNLEERLELDEYERERLVIRWHLGEGSWAQALTDPSLVYGLEWAWLFTKSDNTIGYALAEREGQWRAGASSGREYPLPRYDPQGLTLEKWNAWRTAVDN
ncbi:MAG: hypothetical protein ACTIJ6_00490 [Leucobacter sp.]